MNAGTETRLPSRPKAAALLLAVAFFFPAANAAEPWADLRVPPQDVVGTLSCSAATCHGGSGPRYWSGAMAGAEYAHWLGGTGTYSEGRRHYDPLAVLERTDGDPHALAGQRISSGRFQEVLRRVSGQEDGAVNERTYQQCARCHDPAAIGTAEEIASPSQNKATGLITRSVMATGIGCETCHGGAKRWINIHYQQDVSRERLLELGMVDTKNLLVRARLCAGCHVGSAENDMNHDMIAAGHPPLRFELASYEVLMRKHWDDRPERSADPNYEIQLWAAGRAASAEAALAVLEGRAKRSVESRSAVGDRRSEGQPWPEFAESNCFACHQPLRSVGASTTGSKGGPLRWQSWNVALSTSLIAGQQAQDTDLPPAVFGTTLERLRKAMEESLEPPPADARALAAAARESLRAGSRSDSSGRILVAHGRPITVQTALASGRIEPVAVTWDEMCQQAAMLAAARRAISDATGRSLPNLEQRLTAAARSLRFSTANREWAAIVASPSDMMRIGQELESIRLGLLQVASESLRREP